MRLTLSPMSSTCTKCSPPPSINLCTTLPASCTTTDRTSSGACTSKSSKSSRSRPWMKLIGPGTWLRSSTACGSMSLHPLCQCTLCTRQSWYFSRVSFCSMWLRSYIRFKKSRLSTDGCLKPVAAASSKNRSSSFTPSYSSWGTSTQTRLHLGLTTKACFCARETKMNQGRCQRTARAITYNFQISKRSRIGEIKKRRKTSSSNRPLPTQPTKTTQHSETRMTLTTCLKSTSRLAATQYLYSPKRKSSSSVKF